MFRFLLRNRSRPKLGSLPWCRQWGKRLWTLPSLARFSWRVHRLRKAGVQIGRGTAFSPADIVGNLRFLQVGTESFIGRVSVQLHAPVQIGSRVCINDGVQILTASHDVRDPRWAQFAKPILVGDLAWIATGAIILPGVTIGRGAVVGAGAVVARDVPDYAVAVGNPAVVRENVRARDLRYSPTAFLAFQTAWLGSPRDN